MSKTDDARLARRRLVADLRASGVIRSEHVESAFLAVPRERFLPQAFAEQGIEGVYRDDAIVTKRDPRGMPLSSSSQPGLMAAMLELLDLQPGQRVLEIGAGTGYNAALMAHILGPKGRVTTVDIDADLARHARRSLREAGGRASVVVADGRSGLPARAPYDRIIVTAAADEIPRAWLEQLTDGGRLELPLRLDPDGAAIQLIPVLERQRGQLRSVNLTWGSFMPLHGGDGGWRPLASSLSASRSRRGRQTSLMSVSGAGLSHLSDPAARALLAAMLGPPQRSRRHGTIGLDSANPPLLLIYLLLKIPVRRRITLRSEGRLAVGIIDWRRRGVAAVSVSRSPWMSAGSERPGRGRSERARSSRERPARARWRLDAYADGDAAAEELERLLQEWQRLEGTGRGNPQLTASGSGSGGVLRVRYGWP